MKFQSFYLFYILTIFLATYCFFTSDSVAFFVSAAIVCFVTSVIYHLFYFFGLQSSATLIIVHLGLMVIGLSLTLRLYRILMTFSHSAPFDTKEPSGGPVVIFGPLFLITALITFIVALLKSKKRNG
jgi:hypothetical protein